MQPVGTALDDAHCRPVVAGHVEDQKLIIGVDIALQLVAYLLGRLACLNQPGRVEMVPPGASGLDALDQLAVVLAGRVEVVSDQQCGRIA